MSLLSIGCLTTCFDTVKANPSLSAGHDLTDCYKHWLLLLYHVSMATVWTYYTVDNSHVTEYLLYNWAEQFSKLIENYSSNSQIKFLVPDRIKLRRHSSCPLLHFPNLDRHVWIWCTALVFGNQSLCTNNWEKTTYDL